MWIKFIKVVITCHKKYFHVIIEPAFNLNKTKIYFSACLQNSRHFEFQISSTQGKFLDFSQKRFFHRESFHNEFFQRMGAPAGPGKRGRACPPFAEKIRYETILDPKSFVRSQWIYLESSWFEIQNVSNSAKSRKINFGFVQIESRFNYKRKWFNIPSLLRSISRNER